MRPHQADTLALSQGARHEKNIALTLDACPFFTHGGFDARIVQILVDSCVPAIFFLSGKWITNHRREVKTLASVQGIELGNHSYSHPHCTSISEDSMRREIEQTEFLLKNIAGTSPNLFRPPYGEADQRVEQTIQNMGLTLVRYDIASGDPDSTLSRERIIHYVVTKKRNGSIIVIHVNGRGWHTPEVLPEIIQTLRAKGFVFLSE